MTFTMVGRLSECILLAYRTPAASVASLVPACLRLSTRGEWAFWNIVVCRVDHMRPRGLPRCAGLTYWHVGYRLYVHTPLADGRRLDGLYFVRSDADSRLVSRLGNVATDFHFHGADISATASSEPNSLTVVVRSPSGGDGDARLSVSDAAADATRAHGSLFTSAAEAAAFLKYRPTGLSCGGRGRVKLAEVFRDESQWDEQTLRVHEATWALFDRLGQRDAVLERATRVSPIDYRWRLGRSERSESDAPLMRFSGQ